jgi:hypothetical protein
MKTLLNQIEQKQLQKKSTLESEVYESTEMSPENILPILISVDSFHPLWHEWRAISEHVASFEFRRSPGRNMYFLVKNEYDGKNLGIIDVAADFISLGERDKYIGWSKEDRMKRNRNIANISICVPTRMFGYNMSGGKLLALLAISDEVIQKWEEKYGDKLVGVTVTSLYGRGTQYNRLKYFKYLGVTKGQGSNQIPDKTYKMLRDAVIEHDGKIPSGEFTRGKNSRMSIVRKGCKILGLKSSELTTHGNKRGIYWADLSPNTKDFLCQKIDDLEYYELSKEYLVSYWKETWAYRRLQNLEKENKLLTKKTFF